MGGGGILKCGAELNGGQCPPFKKLRGEKSALVTYPLYANVQKLITKSQQQGASVD